VLGEITEDGQELVLLSGGRGGLGNASFKSATNQAPRHAQPGEEGIEQQIVLELKVLADVGLVGFPNAGKSTLLSVVSAAKPEIADYAFTTMVPNLGVVSYRGFKSFIMADIPGIIEGAAEGKGLGVRFLRHIERNAVLMFMVSAISANIAKEYKILLNELAQYNSDLLEKQRILVITKTDLLDADELKKLKRKMPKNVKYHFISALTQDGIIELKDILWQVINEASTIETN
jgi:GTP-binding protein